MDSRAGVGPRWIAATWLTVLGTGCSADDSAPSEDASTSTSGGAGSMTQPDSSPPQGDALDDSPGSGGIDESGVGMDDDMPLVSNIPDIKRGAVAPGTRVMIQGAIPTTVAFVDGDVLGAMIQDPGASTFGGLRLRTSPELGSPDPSWRIDISGVVDRDARFGLLLRVQLWETLDAAAPPSPVATRTSLIGPGGTRRTALAEMAVVVSAPAGQSVRVIDEGRTPQSFVLDDEVVVDLAPFGVDAPVPEPGALFTKIGGVLVLDGSRSILWPRTADELVPAN